MYYNFYIGSNIFYIFFYLIFNILFIYFFFHFFFLFLIFLLGARPGQARIDASQARPGKDRAARNGAQKRATPRVSAEPIFKITVAIIATLGARTSALLRASARSRFF